MSALQPTPFDVFDFFLTGKMLVGKPPRIVKIQAAEIRPVFNPRTLTDEPSIVLAFENAGRKLKLNKTQAGAMMEITNTDKIASWPGALITLSPTRTKSGKDTITITAGK